MSKAGFRGAPTLAGAFSYKNNQQEPETVGVFQHYIRSQGNAWRLTTEALERFFELILSSEEAKAYVPSSASMTLLARSQESPPALLQQLTGVHLAQVRLLGARTAALHLSLAQPSKDPNFGRELFTTMYRESLYQSSRELLSRTFRQLRRRQDLPRVGRERVSRLLARESALDERLKLICERPIAVVKIRCHGDLRLGRVLSTGDDFVFIDFRGESLRSISERRKRRCVLRDVASMLRSFHYAASTLQERGRRAEDVAVLSPWMSAWMSWTSAAYLGGYLREMAQDLKDPQSAPLLPSNPKDLTLLLDFYLTERCLHELSRGLHLGASWLEVPLAGLEQSLLY